MVIKANKRGNITKVSWNVLYGNYTSKDIDDKTLN